MNERKDAIRDARTLGVPKMLLLGLQHVRNVWRNHSCADSG